MFLVFDTEATGLGSDAEIIQLAYFKLDETLTIRAFGNYYFSSKIPLSDKIKSITGLDDDFLKEKSKGQLVKAKQLEISRLFQGNIPVAHNLAFDRRLVNDNFGYLMCPEGICTMLRYTSTCNIKMFGKETLKPPKLSELLEWTLKFKGITESEFNQLYLDSVNPGVSERNFHNALYDAFATAWIFSVLG